MESVVWSSDEVFSSSLIVVGIFKNDIYGRIERVATTKVQSYLALHFVLEIKVRDLPPKRFANWTILVSLDSDSLYYIYRLSLFV